MKKWWKPMLAFFIFALIGILGGLYFSAHDPLANGVNISEETAKSLGAWGGIFLIPIPILWILGRIEKWVGHKRASAILDMLMGICILLELIIVIVLLAIR